MANKDFFDGKWHVTIPFEKKAKDDDVGMIDLVGLNPGDIKLVKIGHRYMRAWVVEVESEELYRAIMRPINAELRREARENANHTAPASLNQMLEDIGFDVADENELDPALRFQQKGLLAALSDYIATLGDEERTIVIAILTKRRDREVMAELGIAKQSTYSSRKMKVKKQLQKRFKDWQ